MTPGNKKPRQKCAGLANEGMISLPLLPQRCSKAEVL
jgi:hypothetical protein